jgi:large subunit ribosomal protein L29
MDAKEISELTQEELVEKYHKFKEELFHLRFQLATGQLEKTHRLQGLRRDIARVLTFLGRHGTPAPAPIKTVAAGEPKAAKAKAAKAKAPKASTKAPKAPKAEKAPKAAAKAPKAEKAAKPKAKASK